MISSFFERLGASARSLLGVFQHAGFRRKHSGDRTEEAPLENTAGFARETASDANLAALGPATVTRELTGRDVPVRSREEKLAALANVEGSANGPAGGASPDENGTPNSIGDDVDDEAGDVTGFLDQFDPHPLMLEGQFEGQDGDQGPGAKADRQNNGSRGHVEAKLYHTGRTNQ